MALDQEKTKQFKYIGTRPKRQDGVDKVTGQAKYGADTYQSGMLHGAIVRSPHAHAKILSIDTSKAEALEGVKTIVTRAEFATDVTGDNWNILENVMADKTALYDGHAVAAIAATSALIARDAAKLVVVNYEPLPHVTDIVDAISEDAPIIRESSIEPNVPEGYHKNITRRYECGKGDVKVGFGEADLILERDFFTEGVHQGYIEPHACLAHVTPDGKGELWCSTQGHFNVQRVCADLLGMESSQLKVTASEIGGGFGAKTTVFIEPVALALSRKANRPVKLVMNRSEVIRATGPASSSWSTVKVGMKKNGTITAAHGTYRLQGGAFPSAPSESPAQVTFAPYDIEHAEMIGLSIMTNRPKQAAYRAPGAPMGVFASEQIIEEMAHELGIDPIELRLKNAAKEGTKGVHGPTYQRIGLIETLEAAKAHPHYSTPLKENQGRGVAVGFWFNFGGATSVSMALSLDGSVALTVGTPDIGGSRASMALMAAEVLCIPYEDIRVTVADTGSLGHNDDTAGSRVTFAVGLATIEACNAAIKELCKRAAGEWGIEPEAVKWEEGFAVPSGANAGDFAPLSLKELAAKMNTTGGPINGHFASSPSGAGPGFATHLVDVEVDPETGKSTVIRYTVVLDAGKAIHPDYVEGQMQGGAVQGIGWALNEEYVYGKDGRLQNTIFLDYRVPVASDLPMIDCVIIEVPNPGHPFGVRGVGETSIIPPLAAVANAVSAATGVRQTRLPMSPPRVLKGIKDKQSHG